jgi:hypothetical protein
MSLLLIFDCDCRTQYQDDNPEYENNQPVAAIRCVGQQRKNDSISNHQSACGTKGSQDGCPSRGSSEREFDFHQDLQERFEKTQSENPAWRMENSFHAG